MIISQQRFDQSEHLARCDDNGLVYSEPYRNLKLIKIQDGGNRNKANFKLIWRKKMNWRRSQIDGVRKEVYITFRIGIALIPSSNQILQSD